MSEHENTPSETSQKMPIEMAEQEFDRFAELWDIDVDSSSMTEDDLDSFNRAKRPLVRGFRDGWLICDDEGVLTFTLKFSKKLLEQGTSKIKLDPAKADVLSMDKFKDRESMHKLRAYMAAMAGMAPRLFGNIDGRDEKRIRGAILLFLG